MDRVEVLADLKQVKQILRKEGFEDTLLQVVKPGQVFGLVKKLDHPWEMHVRGFEDGHLEAEIEISRDYLEHLDDRYRTSAAEKLGEILSNYGIPYEIKSDGSGVNLKLETPETLTPWKPIALVIGLLGIMYVLSKRES